MMTRRFLSSLLIGASVFGLGALVAPGKEARACAVLTPDQTTPVVGHQMILSVSNDQTTLWDRFQYTGDPSSFGWILPTKGVVDVGVSSDAIFNAFGQITAPAIFAPSICPNSCDGQGGGSVGNGGVTVIAEEAVGPYLTVQLSSADPNALKDWLSANGYPIPATIAPLLDTFVTEGFDFLAVKLNALAGNTKTVPLRISSPGASPVIPLRLLQAGTGDLTQVTLFIVSEGRYEPTNAPVITMASQDLTWDFAADSSDYLEVKTSKLAASGGLAWLLEQAQTYQKYEIEDPLSALVSDDPAGSGYGPTPVEAEAALAADMSALLGTLTEPVWVTRITADLSREALNADLFLEASPTQEIEDGQYAPTKYKNEGECPPDPCASGGGGAGAGAGGSGGAPGNGGSPGVGGSAEGGNGAGNDGNLIGGGGACGCGVPGDAPESGWWAVALAGLLSLGRRRRGR